MKSPHVGWNSLDTVREDSRLLRGVAAGGFVYYTHSWRAPVVSCYCFGYSIMEERLRGWWSERRDVDGGSVSIREKSG